MFHNSMNSIWLHWLVWMTLWTIGYGRVVYVVIHAEKPGTGSLDEKVEGGETMSSMEGLGHPSDGLGYTGMLRAACMTNNFGPAAPYYRQPKRIITQHFLFQNNGDFINNGHRGHHTSRRMYHQTYALALSLGIDPDEEICCGGSFDDILNYIYTLPPEDDPILIVNQHGVCNTFIKGYALSYGQSVDVDKFGRQEDKVWTMIDGQFVEEWFMCCDAIPSSRCTGNAQQPAWVASYQFPSTVQRAPLVKEVEYPSFIFTPSNLKNTIGWNYNSYLRKRGVWSGEECFNEDIVEPIANVTNFDLRKREETVQPTSQSSQTPPSSSQTNETPEIDDEDNSSVSPSLNQFLLFTSIFFTLLIFI